MTVERLEVLKESEKSKVYLVFDTENRRMLVEKHLRGQREIYQTLQTIHHPYLPRLYDVRFEEGETVVTEEYITGGSLAQIKANEAQISKWLLELCQVLDLLHGHHILHRDIKPSNLLLGEDGHIRLIDFDAARQAKEEAETDTQLLGTRGYAPPEQYGFAQTDQRADIYALGVTFRGLLGTAGKKCRWRRILKRCTALEPKRRYRSVWQIRLAIHAGRLRRRVIYPLAAVVLCLFVGLMAWSFGTDGDFRAAFSVVWTSKRDAVFETADMGQLQQSDATIQPHWGDTQEIYRRLMTAQPGRYISTGYADENGNLLFGGFSVRYNMKTGEQYYEHFEGLYAITPTWMVRHIRPEDCNPYAPAVLALYQLDVFDTPLI